MIFDRFDQPRIGNKASTALPSAWLKRVQLVTSAAPRPMPTDGMPWRVRVLAAFPDGECIARMTSLLADGSGSRATLWRAIYRALRACESNGLARRSAPQHQRFPLGWSQDLPVQRGPRAGAVAAGSAAQPGGG
jgi:hypothetical protein